MRERLLVWKAKREDLVGDVRQMLDLMMWFGGFCCEELGGDAL